jgi:predicted dehydrogenase
MKIAIIGTGKITDRFIDAAKGQDIEIKAVLSRDGERGRKYADARGIERVFTDIESLADSDIDAAYIASPNSCHAPQAIALLERGKHVLCEKPLTATYEDAEKMFAAAERGNAVLLEALRSIDPGFYKLRELLPAIGTIRRVQFVMNQYSSRYDNFKRGIIENAFDPTLANAALMDIGVYCVGPLVRLFGEPESVSAESVFMPNNMEGMGTALLRYPGMLAEVQYSKITKGCLPSQIQGEDGSLLIDAIEDIRRIERVMRDGSREEYMIDKRENNMYYEVETFLSLVKTGTSEPYRAWSLSEMKTMDMIRRDAGVEFVSRG